MALPALEQVATWPVPHAAVAAVAADGSVLGTYGDTGRPFRLASLAKPVTVWAVLVAVEDGSIGLDTPVGQPGCTLRHLLAHAGGYPFEGPEPISPPEQRRIYSNTGIELAVAATEAATGIPFGPYLAEAVFEPLGMTASELRGSPAHAIHSTVDDVVRLLAEWQRPALLAPETAADAVTPQYPNLAGIVPGVGRFDPCPWGLGFEIRGDKSPHWTGRANSAATYGHFGGAGTVMWVDPDARCGLVALTDRPFDDWSIDAMKLWPALADAVIADVGAGSGDRAGGTST
jgi:CubicO group peptidase (beta-lactamase class C family)